MCRVVHDLPATFIIVGVEPQLGAASSVPATLQRQVKQEIAELVKEEVGGMVHTAFVALDTGAGLEELRCLTLCCPPTLCYADPCTPSANAVRYHRPCSALHHARPPSLSVACCAATSSSAQCARNRPSRMATRKTVKRTHTWLRILRAISKEQRRLVGVP